MSIMEFVPILAHYRAGENAPRDGQVGVGGSAVARVDVDEHQLAHASLGRETCHIRQTAMAGQSGQFGFVVREMALVHQEVHALDRSPVGDIARRRCVGDVGEGAPWRIEPKSGRTTRVCQAEVCQLATVGERHLGGQGL